jgi:heptosyltransferase I
VVRAIQSQWPDCSITWVIGKPEHQLLGGLAGVEFIVFDKSRGLRAYADLHRALKGKSYDVLLHMQVAARANLASLLIRSPLKLGWDNGRSRDRHKWFVNHQVPAAERQHQAQGFLSFARSLGLNIEQPSWNLPISDKARSFARNRISGDRPSLLISPCSSHVLRNWRAEYYAAVADYAISKLGMQVVLSGGPSKIDRDMGSSIQAHMHGRVLNLIGKDTLELSLGLLARADIVLSPDSGPVHIANALGTPVIGLYACTWSLRSGPANSLEYCVDRFSEASRKFKNREPEQLRWGTRIEEPGVMDLIEVDDVVQKLELAHASLETRSSLD